MASWHRFFLDFHGFWTPSWVGKSDKIRSDQVRSGQIRSEHGQTREDKTKTSQSGLISLVKTSSQGKGPFPPHLAGKGGVHPTYKDVSSPGPRTRGAAAGRSHFLRVFRYLAAFLFYIVFSMPFCIDLGSILLSNLPPKIHQNR